MEQGVKQHVKGQQHPWLVNHHQDIEVIIAMYQ
jgi:hypothetical protein